MLLDEKLILEAGGATREVTLPPGSVTIGRAATSDIPLADAHASRSHARLDVTPAGREIVDLGSANGVLVNGARVTRALLAPGDRIVVGETVLRYEAVTPDEDEEATRVLQTNDSVDTIVMAPSLPVHLEDTSEPPVTGTTERGTSEVRLTRDATTIGRHHTSDIVLDWPAVSRHHAVLERRADAVVVRDLNSRNGVTLRGERITEATLRDGDSIEIGPARLVFKGAFDGTDLTLAGVPRRALSKRPPVVIVPGFGGSMLWRGSEQVWPVPRTLLSRPQLLDFDEPLEARGLVDEIVVIPNLIKQDQYSALTSYLKEDLVYEAGRDLLEFAYDFRQDNRDSARALGRAIEAWDPGEPVTIIAHSMGCLVARYYVDCLGGSRRVNRVIYLGAPHAGTPYAFASLVHGPDLLPLGLLNARLRDVLATYPSWYQILPT
ncbi:MAG TPA: FHA domain-containing protein, partial [Vicinamibacterales bacterium]|nr:FHA domain-containing protein [Vicinamibacterales bacterium]